MGKENVVGLLVESHPMDLSPPFLKLSDLLFLWVIRYGFLMTFEADGKVRYAREGLRFVESVAMVAV